MSARPVCCGRNATPYTKKYGEHSIEQGFRCKKCGAIRIPYLPPTPPEELARREAETEALRLEGIAFDESLSNPNPAVAVDNLV